MLHLALIAAAVAVGVSLGITFRRTLVSLLGFGALVACAVVSTVCAWFAFDGMFLHRDPSTTTTYFLVVVVAFGFFLATVALWEVQVGRPAQRTRNAAWAAETARVGTAVHKRMTAYVTNAFKEFSDPGLAECAAAMQRGIDGALLNTSAVFDAGDDEYAGTGAMLANAYLSTALGAGSLEQPQYINDVRYVMQMAQLRIFAKLGDPDETFMWDVRYGSMNESRLREIRAAWRKAPELVRSIYEGAQVDQPAVLAFAQK